MNLVTVATGVLILVYGIFMLITRIKTPEKHARLRFLRKTLGNGKGGLIHTVVYIIAPFALAAYLISYGLAGESLGQIFTPPVRTE